MHTATDFHHSVVSSLIKPLYFRKTPIKSSGFQNKIATSLLSFFIKPVNKSRHWEYTFTALLLSFCLFALVSEKKNPKSALFVLIAPTYKMLFLWHIGKINHIATPYRQVCPILYFYRQYITFNPVKILNYLSLSLEDFIFCATISLPIR